MKQGEQLRVVAVVQARMSSRRLPGKVLRPIAGQPMIGLLIDRLENCEDLDGICVATSEEASDNPVAAYCASRAVRCHRGALDNVAARLLGAAESMNADAFVRISGDSPFIDPSIVSQLVRLYRREMPDLASNVLVRSYPKGQSAEVVSVRCLRDNLVHFNGVTDNEHVTTYFYRNRESFRIASMVRDNSASTVQMSVDSPEDFERAVRLAGLFRRPHWSYGVDELLTMLDGIPA